MEIGDISLRCAWALVDELVRHGVRHACLSPGSRSTPLALALARHPSIELQIHLDERSSAFVALGLARASRRPVIVACTSGTAAAELFPAVVEASRSRVPLVLLTADRPPRLRGTGANQTIDQVNLYGSYADYLEPPVPSGPEDDEAWRATGRDAVGGLRRTWQPVQVNCPFEEPLTPSADVALDASDPGSWAPLETTPLSDGDGERLVDELSGARGVAVIGGTWPHDVTDVALGTFERLGLPVLAEPISNLRRPGTLAAGQSLIADEVWLAEHRPDVVLQLGATPTTRATQSFVASAERLIVADRVHPDPDPEHRATWRLRADLPAVVDAIHALDAPAPDGWLAAWREADDHARRAIDAMMDTWDEPFEPRIARVVAAAVPPGSTLVVGSSAPVRDLDLAMAPRDGISVIANRGASGIDGTISAAIGVAAATRRPTTALLGDLTTLHDLGALAWNASEITIDLTLVVVNNGGGHIFSLLPQRDLPEHRDLFVTPHDTDLGALCEALSVAYLRVARANELPEALDATRADAGIRLIDVMVASELGIARRAELRSALRSAP